MKIFKDLLIKESNKTGFRPEILETGRDMYRMFVIEQEWTSDEYEKWLTQVLISTLIDEKKR